MGLVRMVAIVRLGFIEWRQRGVMGWKEEQASGGDTLLANAIVHI